MADRPPPRTGLTRHACRRALQRQIPFYVIELVRRFGRAVFDGSGRVLATDALPCPSGVERRWWSETRGVRVVEDATASVVTVFRRDRQGSHK